MAVGARTLRLERVALNLDDSSQPDNSGEIAEGRAIEAEGPIEYRSSLPLERMLDALEERGVPAVISNHAGTFLCNHVFYVARHQVEQLGIGSECGFIHVPAMSEHSAGRSDFGLPLALMVEGIECCLGVLRGD